MTSFDAFEAELKVLCERYQACLAVTLDGKMGLWDWTDNDRAVYDLTDCRLPVRVETKRPSGIPDGFLGSLSASLHAGFICVKSSCAAAMQTARGVSHSTVVPIGPGSDRQEWAVISQDRRASSSRRIVESKPAA